MKHVELLLIEMEVLGRVPGKDGPTSGHAMRKVHIVFLEQSTGVKLGLSKANLGIGILLKRSLHSLRILLNNDVVMDAIHRRPTKDMHRLVRPGFGKSKKEAVSVVALWKGTGPAMGYGLRVHLCIR